MSHAYILYFPPDPVSSTLEAISRCISPLSRLQPHVTVRYGADAPRLGAELDYANLTVDEVDFLEPASFDDRALAQHELTTVLIQVASDVLEQYTYKPSFPDTFLHLTLYDGRPSRIAALAYEAMAQHDWSRTYRFESSPVMGSRPQLPPALPGRPRISPGAMSAIADASSWTRETDLLGAPEHERAEVVGALVDALVALPQLERRLGGKNVDMRPVQQLDEAQPMLWDLAPRKRSQPTIEVGVHLTPPELARDVVNTAISVLAPDEDIAFCDPAIGPGVFFASLLAVTSHAKIESAVGVELSPDRAAAAQRRWNAAGLGVFVGDFLTAVPPASGVNLLVSNPPYIRSQLQQLSSTAAARQSIRSHLGLEVSGRTDLYVYFLLAAHKWLREDGVAAWLIPAEFLVAAYGRALRKYLSEHVELVRVHSYSRERSMFDDVRVTSTVVVYRKRKRDAAAMVTFSRGGTIANPDEAKDVRVQHLASLDKWAWVALDESPRTRPVGAEIGDLFHVRRGMATGANAYFVLTEGEANDLDPDRRIVQPILPPARAVAAKVVTADTEGVPAQLARNWVIDSPLSLEQISEEAPRLARYLANMPVEVRERRLVSNRRPAWRQELIPPAPYLARYMASGVSSSGRGRFVLNQSRATHLNSFIGLYPLPWLAEWLGQSRERRLELLDHLDSIDHHEYALHGRTYAGGLLKVEPGDLRRLWVPLSQELLGRLEAARQR